MISITLFFLFIAKTSSAQLPEIHRFHKFELNVNPVTDINDTFIRNLALRHYHDWANNFIYNKDSIYLQADFTACDGTIKTINGFYYEHWEFDSKDTIPGNGKWSFLNANEPKRDSGMDSCWKVRFTPEVEGLYHYVLKFVAPGRSLSEIVDTGSFVCLAALSEKDGFVRLVNGECFENSDGSPFKALGINAFSYPQWFDPAPIANYYDTLFSRIKENGGNVARICINNFFGISLTGFRRFEEGGRYHLRELSQADAFCFDTIVALAEKHNIKLDVRFYHEQNLKGDWGHYNAFNKNRYFPWGDTSYDRGVCEDTVNFFTDTIAITIQNHLYKYMIDRWGYSTSIFSWEAFAECDGSNDFKPHLANWHAIQLDTIRDYDPYHRAVTTSFMSLAYDNNKINPHYINTLNHADYVVLHRYLGQLHRDESEYPYEGYESSQYYKLFNDSGSNEGFRQKLYTGGCKKPVQITEGGNFGPVNNIGSTSELYGFYTVWDSMALCYHQLMWSSLMHGGLGPYYDFNDPVFLDTAKAGIPATHTLKQLKGISRYMDYMPSLGKFGHEASEKAIDFIFFINNQPIPDFHNGYFLRTPETNAVYGYLFDIQYKYSLFVQDLIDSISTTNPKPWTKPHRYLGSFNSTYKPDRLSVTNQAVITNQVIDPGKKKIRWFDTETGDIVSTDYAEVGQGSNLILTIPGLLQDSDYGDAAFIIEPTDAGWDNEALANPSDQVANLSDLIYCRGSLYYLSKSIAKPKRIQNAQKDLWVDGAVTSQAAPTDRMGSSLNLQTEDLFYVNSTGQLCQLARQTNGSYSYSVICDTTGLVSQHSEIHWSNGAGLYCINAHHGNKLSVVSHAGGQWQPPAVLNAGAPAASSIRGFTVKAGQKDTLFYFNGDGHIYQLYLDANNAWQYSPTYQDANIIGRQYTELHCGKRNDLFYVREAGQLCVLTRIENDWDGWILNEKAPSVMPCTGFAVDTLDGYAIWYAGTDRNIYKLYDDGSRWVWQQFNLAHSSCQGVKDSSDMVVANGQVFFVAKSDGKIHRLRQVFEIPFTVVGSTTDQYDVWDVSGVDGNERVYKFYLPETRSIDVTTCGGITNYDTKVEIFKQDGSSTGYSNDHCTCNLSGTFATLKDVLLSGGYYFVVVDGAQGTTGDFTLAVEDPCQGLKHIDGMGLINDTTWAGNSRVCGGLEIGSGVTLTVKCNVRFLEHTGILIHPGGKLILDGGHLTAVECADFWDGIQVHGNPELQQLPVNQGVLEIINGGTISRAKYAIQAPRRNTDQDLVIETNAGGILKLDNARIINNENGIWIGPYQNKRMVAGVTQLLDNVSYIRNCHFENNQQYSMDKIPGCHIGLHGVKRVKIEGNTFENTTSALYWNNGNGIESFDAELWVTERCASQQTPCPATVPNTFKGLNYGIRVWGSTPGNPVTIRGNLFDNVYRSIYANGCTRAIIHQNTIKVPNQLFNYNPPISTAKASQNDKAPYGIYLDYCTGFEVQENTLTTLDAQGRYDSTHAIIINNSGPNSNEIYQNIIRDFRYAISPQNENKSNLNDYTGLKLKCNQMDTNYRDIFVASDPTLHTKGVCFYQGAESGSNSFGAGNTFTAASANDRQFCNAGMDPVIYYYYTGEQNQIPLYTSDITPTQGDYYDSTTQCLSKIFYYPQSITSLYSQFATAQTELNSDKLIRDIYINGGQENLEQTVELTLPWEAYTMFNALMNESPYLSEDVLLAAVENPVFSDLMIKLICIANPHCTRMQSVMDAVYDRNPPMPESYIEQIMDGGETVSQLEVLEANVSESMHQVEQIINQIKRVYETDTANSWASDSLTSLFTWHNNLFSRYELAIKHLYNGDTELIDELLEALPEEFAMEDPELAAHQDCVDYFELLELLREEERLPVELTGEEIEGLLTLVSNDRSYASAWARTILKLSGIEYLYQEPIIIETEFLPRKGRIRSSKTNIPLSLKVYPNPAKTFVNVDLSNFAIANNDLLKVADLKGNEVFYENLKMGQPGCVIDVKNWKPGIYVFTFWHEGKAIASTRVSIL